MQKHIRKLLEHNALFIALATTIGIAVLSLTSVPKVNFGLSFKSSDKYLHTFAYFTLTFIWLFVFRKQYPKLSFKIIALSSLTVYGIILEGLQGSLTSYRTADFYDALANFTGIVLAILLFKKFINWYNMQ